MRMSESWFMNIESYVFTVFEKRMNDKFDRIFCTTSNKDIRERHFPCVYLHLVEQSEVGNDLDNITINAVRTSFRVQVYSKTAAECRAITTEAVLQLKKLRFNVIEMPVYASERDKSVFFSDARFSRIIGGGDSDIVPQD